MSRLGDWATLCSLKYQCPMYLYYLFKSSIRKFFFDLALASVWPYNFQAIFPPLDFLAFPFTPTFLNNSGCSWYFFTFLRFSQFCTLASFGADSLTIFLLDIFFLWLPLELFTVSRCDDSVNSFNQHCAVRMLLSLCPCIPPISAYIYIGIVWAGVRAH